MTIPLFESLLLIYLLEVIVIVFLAVDIFREANERFK
jgi:hypothetical protein